MHFEAIGEDKIDTDGSDHCHSVLVDEECEPLLDYLERLMVKYNSSH